MKISRRDFTHAGCTVAAISLIPKTAEAWIHGSAPTNNNRVTINVPGGAIYYANLAKGFGFIPDPTNQDANGYPVTTPAAIIGSNPSMPANYYGTFTWSWNGTGSMQILGAPPIVVTSGGTAIFEIGTNSGDKASSNLTLTSQANPNVVFAFGWNIQAISNNGSGLIRVTTKTGFMTGAPGTGTVVNIAGANANTNANGLWTITVIDAQNFDLQGSTFANTQGIAGQSILAAKNMTIRINNTGTFSGFTNLIWARTADYSAVNAGTKVWCDDLVNQLKYLLNNGVSNASRGWLRFMDSVGVQNSFECDSSQRRTLNSLNYDSSSSWYPAGYWVGTITNTANAYTCADPSVSVWNGSSYIDNSIVMGAPNVANTGGLPTLAVGGHPAKPVYDYGEGVPGIVVKLTGPPTTPGTDVMQFKFSAGGASWFNGGVDYTVNYNTVAGDTSISNLAAHLDVFFGADSVLTAASVFHGNPQSSVGPYLYPRTAQAGRLTLTYLSGPAICIPSTITASTISSANKGVFVYNYLLDGWIYKSSNAAFSIPWEAIVNLGKTVGAHCWYCLPHTKGQYITDLGNFFGDPTTGLTSGLRFGIEAWNEVWNSSAFPFKVLQGLGNTLGWTSSSFQSNYSYTGLRTIQYAALAKVAWIGKGRSASDFYVFQPTATFDTAVGSNFDTSQLKGTFLSASNMIYSTYGGLNGSGAEPAHTAPGSRPGDITTATGCAPYWGSPWFGKQASNITGPITQHVPWLQACLDFANGNTATAFASMVNQFNGTTTRAAGSPSAITLGPGVNQNFYNFVFTSQEAQAAQYDVFRTGAGIAKMGVIHYEAAPEWAVGNNAINGTNSTSDTAPLITQIIALQISNPPWDVSPYTVSGTNNVTELVNQVLALIQGWKNDTDKNGNATGLNSYKNFIKTSYYQSLATISGANREAKGAQYGNPGTTWGYFPVTLFSTAQYKNYDATHEWDAGG